MPVSPAISATGVLAGLSRATSRVMQLRGAARIDRAADAFAAWAGLAMFGFWMNGAALFAGFAAGMVFTRRTGPLAGSGRGLGGRLAGSGHQQPVKDPECRGVVTVPAAVGAPAAEGWKAVSGLRVHPTSP